MAEVKVLTGDRVTLRAPRLADAGELFASVASDPEVTRYMSWTPHPDVDETQRVIAELFNVGVERTWLIDVGSGLNGKRPMLRRVLSDPDAKLIIVEHQDRLARFGVEHVEAALAAHGRRIVVADPGETTMIWCAT